MSDTLHDAQPDTSLALDLLLLLGGVQLGSAGILAAAAVTCARHSPLVCAGVQALAAQARGAPLALPTDERARFWLPGLPDAPPSAPPRAPENGRRAGAAGGSDGALLQQLLAQPSPPGAQPSPPTSRPSAGQVLPFAVWRKQVLAAHNVIVVGVPQSGKTTFTRAFLPAVARRGQVVVLDPHGRVNDWGLAAVGAGRELVAELTGASEELFAQPSRRHAVFHHVVELARNAARIDKLAHRYRAFLYFVGALIWLR